MATRAVTLAVTLPSIGDELEVVELVRAAHEVWPYSNATRGNIDVLLTANGHGLEPADSLAADVPGATRAPRDAPSSP